MQTLDIGWGEMAVGLLLMLIPFCYLWYIKSRLFKPTLWATVRMCVQLFLMGVYFRYLFVWNNPWINTLWVIVMIAVAACTFIQRTGLRRQVLLLPMFVALTVSAFLIGFYFLVFVLKMENPFDARYFIPIMGLLLGLGIVSMPGTMIGQILGGSDPDVAIKYQIMIVVITLASSLLSVVVTVKLAALRSFDKYQVLQSHFTYKKDKFNEMDMF